MTGPADDEFCPHFHYAVELIGRRWTGCVLRSMLQGATRFSEIASHVPNISDKMLAERLKELEAEGLVSRTVIPETPVRVEYGLTEKGAALEQVVNALAEWAHAWVPLAGDGATSCPPQASTASSGGGAGSDAGRSAR